MGQSKSRRHEAYLPHQSASFIFADLFITTLSGTGPKMPSTEIISSNHQGGREPYQVCLECNKVAISLMCLAVLLYLEKVDMENS